MTTIDLSTATVSEKVSLMERLSFYLNEAETNLYHASQAVSRAYDFGSDSGERAARRRDEIKARVSALQGQLRELGGRIKDSLSHPAPWQIRSGCSFCTNPADLTLSLPVADGDTWYTAQPVCRVCMPDHLGPASSPFPQGCGVSGFSGIIDGITVNGVIMYTRDSEGTHLLRAERDILTFGAHSSEACASCGNVGDAPAPHHKFRWWPAGEYAARALCASCAADRGLIADRRRS